MLQRTGLISWSPSPSLSQLSSPAAVETVTMRWDSSAKSASKHCNEGNHCRRSSTLSVSSSKSIESKYAANSMGRALSRNTDALISATRATVSTLHASTILSVVAITLKKTRPALKLTQFTDTGQRRR